MAYIAEQAWTRYMEEHSSSMDRHMLDALRYGVEGRVGADERRTKPYNYSPGVTGVVSRSAPSYDLSDTPPKRNRKLVLLLGAR